VDPNLSGQHPGWLRNSASEASCHGLPGGSRKKTRVDRRGVSVPVCLVAETVKKAPLHMYGRFRPLDMWWAYFWPVCVDAYY